MKLQQGTVSYLNLKFSTLNPTVGRVSTVFFIFILYNIVLFPAASSPNMTILVSFILNSTLLSSFPMFSLVVYDRIVIVHAINIPGFQRLLGNLYIFWNA